MIGIIVAVEEELNAILSCVSNIKVEEKYDTRFYVGDILSENNSEKKECVITLCGVGKVNSARTTQLLIDAYAPEYVMNVGVAGGISDKAKIGEIIIGEKLVQYDFDLTAFGREKGELPGGLGKFIYSDKELVIRAYNILSQDRELNGALGVIASGDQFVTDKKQSKEIHEVFGADCVEMEGAAMAQVCFLCHVPFIVIRSISDSPNDNNKIDYETFLEMASKNVAKFVSKLIQ